MQRVNYKEAICVLLHDVGKAFLRFKKRYELKHETGQGEIYDLIKNNESHNEIGRTVVLKYTEGAIDLSICRDLYDEIIKISDHTAAAERGLPTQYRIVKESWSSIENSIKGRLGVDYNHYMTPLLSPLWIARIGGYMDATGPCSRTSFTYERALEKLLDIYYPIIRGLENNDPSDLANAVANFITSLKDENLWIAPQPLTIENIMAISPGQYEDAQRKIDYAGIVRWIREGLEQIHQIYGSMGLNTRGFIDTLSELLKYTLLTVPAAVYMALPPDTSLYSHSKIATAYASAGSVTSGVSNNSNNSPRYRLMIVDARRIQDFVASPVVAKAASRVIRGRSLLVELVTMSLVNYILELYGGLPYTNVLTMEGGTLDIIVPSLSRDLESKIMSSIKEYVKATYESLHGIPFTIQLSSEFGLKDVNFMDNLVALKHGRNEGFLMIQEDLERKLSIQKIRDESIFRLNVNEDAIAGFDAITRELVTKAEIHSGFGLKIDESLTEYSNVISGGKLSNEDLISESTHLSLVAGTALRGAVTLVSIYTYTKNPSDQDIAIPDEERIKKLVNCVQSVLSKYTKKKIDQRQLYIKVYYEDWSLGVAIIPIKTLGALHILINTFNPSSEAEGDIMLVPRRVGIKLALDIIKELDNTLIEEGRSRIELRVVNTGVEFIEVFTGEYVQKTLSNLIKRGLDIYLGTMFLGVFHPYKIIEEEDGSLEIAHVDLDIYDFISMSKSDIDNLGEVKKLLSLSPTRLSMLSDFLTLIVIYKTHLIASDYVCKMLVRKKTDTKEMRFRHVMRGPIILYAGGDDIAIYGYWVDVLLFIDKLHREVLHSIYPLTFTTAMTLEKSDYPLLELYLRAVNALSEGKKEAKGWIFITDLSSPRIVQCSSDSSPDCKITRGIVPTEALAHMNRVQLCTQLEVFETIAKVLENLENNPSNLSKLLEYKRELVTISRLANVDRNTLGKLGRILSKDTRIQVEEYFDIIKRGMAFSYLSIRRKDDFEKLEDNIKSMIGTQSNVRLHHIPGTDIITTLNRAICSKTFIDILVFYINTFSRELNT